MENPFIVKGYRSKELFCDREKELDNLLQNCTNGIDTTIISLRRMGKTGLILRLFDEIKALKLPLCSIYVDIYVSRSLEDFIRLLAEAVLKAFPESSSLGQKFMTFIKSLRPQISFDSMTGEPQIQIAYQTANEKDYTLRGLLDFLDNQNIQILVAIDEFQQIREYSEINMEGILRTYIQQLKNVHFIFCGSKKHLMADIFTNVKKPFYSSTRFLTLDKIPAESYSTFISSTFEQHHRNITPEAVDYILHWTKRHTFYTQNLCNAVFASSSPAITVETVKEACLSILQLNEPIYLQYRQLLTPAQWNFLIAVAKEQEVEQITAQDFLMKYRIGSASTSKRIAEALYEKELLVDHITKNRVIYSVYDVFLSRWLEREY